MKKKDKRKKKAGSSTITVTITDTPWGPQLNKEPVYVGDGEEIDWQYAPSTRFTVEFKHKSPFKRGTFDHKHPHSGNPTVSANPHKVYRYSVKTSAGKVAPGVIVN